MNHFSLNFGSPETPQRRVVNNNFSSSAPSPGAYPSLDRLPTLPPDFGFEPFDWGGFEPHRRHYPMPSFSQVTSGDQGVNTPDLGWHGKNAFANLNAGTQTIKYTNQFGQKENPNLSPFYDALGFAEAGMAPADTNNDGVLSRAELVNSSGNQRLADNLLRAFDLDNSGGLDLGEAGIQVLLEDSIDGLDGHIEANTHDTLLSDLSNVRWGTENADFYRTHAEGIAALKESPKPDYALERTYSEIVTDYKDNAIYEPVNQVAPEPWLDFPPPPLPGDAPFSGGASGGINQILNMLVDLIGMLLGNGKTDAPIGLPRF